GMGHTVFVAGTLLLPFSVMTFTASRSMDMLGRRLGERWVTPLGCAIYLGSVVVFLVGHHSIAALVVMSTGSGFGMGILLASLPRLLVSGVTRVETGSALGFNQLLRSIGGAV